MLQEGVLRLKEGGINFFLFKSLVFLLLPRDQRPNVVFIPSFLGNLINCVTSPVSNLLPAVRFLHHAVTPQVGSQKHPNSFLHMEKCKKYAFIKKLSSQNSPALDAATSHSRSCCPTPSKALWCLLCTLPSCPRTRVAPMKPPLMPPKCFHRAGLIFPPLLKPTYKNLQKNDVAGMEAATG